ncbi:putative proline--tRNA ligase: mitochondrial-like isoform X1 [Dinothrombium tinctorium]|uniref:proline--tRNA ligase n=1 Tax=Dinothrombium tinctorium TaxID=1965070 RepID=A0A443R278_9ACAR|nr:putative proline--tRNA ligase: mitochondrial-like isoform X1 [Dinothrombium tinctorium]
MEAIGAQRILMPSMVHSSLLQKSGRWTQYARELFRLKDRNDEDYCLAPTHEEVVTGIVKHNTVSKKQLPLFLYQISNKFRDEIRHKKGLLRAKEFIMKDLYTFDLDELSAQSTYENVCESYSRIFKRLKLNFKKVKATTGLIGGKVSHEFHLLSNVGEDTLMICESCGYGCNEDIEVEMKLKLCPYCNNQLVSQKAIEVGHSFLLGTKYTEPFELSIDNKYLEMGCFGLGVSRILAAAVEVLSTENQMRFPLLIAPYKVSIITPKKGSNEEKNNITQFGEDLASHLSDNMFYDDVIIDDRSHLTIGRRMNDNKLWGIPYIVVVGKKALNETPKVEMISAYNNESFEMTQSEIIDYFNRVRNLNEVNE